MSATFERWLWSRFTPASPPRERLSIDESVELEDSTYALAAEVTLLWYFAEDGTKCWVYDDESADVIRCARTCGWGDLDEDDVVLEEFLNGPDMQAYVGTHPDVHSHAKAQGLTREAFQAMQAKEGAA